MLPLRMLIHYLQPATSFIGKALHVMSSLDISILSIQEPNMHWTDHIHKSSPTHTPANLQMTNAATSNSTEPSHNMDQPGGMVTAIVGAYIHFMHSELRPKPLEWVDGHL